MKPIIDGPVSPHFKPVPFAGYVYLDDLSDGTDISSEMAAAVQHAPGGDCVAWGIPFEVGKVVVVSDAPVSVTLPPTQARWFVFMHTSDVRPVEPGPDGFISPMRGSGQLNEHAADYVLLYEDGTEARIEIRRRHQIGAFQRGWGENCFQAVAQHKPSTWRPHHEQMTRYWGGSQTRVDAEDDAPWNNWLWAWENPHPKKAIVGVRFEPVSGVIVVSAIAAGEASEHPLRWRSRRKAVLTLPEGVAFQADLDAEGLLEQIQLDMGQVISALPRLVYPNATWGDSYNNQVPEKSECEVLIEYTAHPDANFHLWDGTLLSVKDLTGFTKPVRSIAPATQRVTLKVVDKDYHKPVAVKLHVHGEADEYLAPVDRHRIVNPSWFEDYSVDFTHRGLHQCTYIPGETVIDLPLGTVYIEVSKGFEIRPVRKVVEVTAETTEIGIEIEKVLPWRERGWVTADTHVHFLSPMSALLEGAGEGVNVVNLLASQWGELMTNVGDFDGKNTWGSKETGGEGEYLVRVGTENRQHVMGHISLLGYRGHIIAPMTTGGPDESAIGDPIEILLTEWARQCKKQGGLVVLPHFPNPRAENAASIISGDIDALEMTSWGDL
ncbi:MAG: hypothetical protein ACK2UQ_18545, partial [Anaerolineae bacterium]